VGHDSLDAGEIVKSQKLKIGYLEQESKEPLDISAEEFLAQTSMTPIWELKSLGHDLGLTDKHFAVPFQELSGGYRMRMKLLALIGKEPNLMLLDEPTNFLDLESILTLEKFLQGYRGAFMLISHDREFLRRTTDHTLEVETGDITKFPGTIDDYFEQKALLRSILSAQAANQESKRKSIQDFVDRFGAKATKARQAQSRLKQLEKMEKIEIKDLGVKAKIKIPPPIHTGKETLSLHEADLGYEQKVVVKNCNLRIEKGSHIGVVGYNGAGKSTLLKSLAGRIPFLAGDKKIGYQVSLSYYAQHVAEELNPDDTVLSSLQGAAQVDVKGQEILNMAGSLLFSGDSVHKRIRVLSGGEKSRVALGQILLKRSPLLLMDEPTNHLDFDTVEALTEALRDYEGTVVVVSHDRSFIGRIASKILEIRDGRAEIYPGTYDDYLWSLERGALRERSDSAADDKVKNRIAAGDKGSLNQPGADFQKGSVSIAGISMANQGESQKLNFREESKRLQSLIKDLTKRVSKSEGKLKSAGELIEKLNLEVQTAKGLRVSELSKEIHFAQDDLQKCELELLHDMEALEKAELDLKNLKKQN
jgi:ATP-binding cassette subfamily F protein 3